MPRQELEKLIALGEGQTLGFKRANSSGLGRELCALANSQGGQVLIGMDDHGQIQPLRAANKFKSEVQSLISDYQSDYQSDYHREQILQVLNLLQAGTQSSIELLQKSGLKHRSSFMKNYLKPVLNANLIEMTDPHNPRSRFQKYRLKQRPKHETD